MPKGDLARLCLLYGASLKPDLAHTDDGFGQPIDGPKLLWAMAGRESTFGKDLGPRHEPAYDFGGLYYRTSADLQHGIALYGRDYACSYGPLQIMACNAKGYSPFELGADPEKALGAAVARLRIEVLGRQLARTLDQICDCWNTGNAKDANVPHEYIAAVRHYYITEVIG
jgi:hypothetical protein